MRFELPDFRRFPHVIKNTFLCECFIQTIAALQGNCNGLGIKLVAEGRRYERRQC
jgi:hypothetical protein